MANNNNDRRNNNKELPTFSGNQMPQNISFVNNEDDIGEERTRRIGGFTPSFSSVDISSSPHAMGVDFATTTTETSTKRIIAAETTTTTSKKTSVPPSVVVAAAWNLPYAPFVPPFGHPLETTAVFLPRTTSSVVSQRVSLILQERDIQTKYRKNEAECLTLDNVEFSVFLYKGQNEYSHGIIVEVQRHFGNSVNFYNDTKAILDGVQKDHSLKHKNNNNEISPPLPLTDGVIPDAASLQFALKMLRSRKDVQLLGLRILSSLTDVSKMGNEAASATSIGIISSGNELLNEIFEIVAQEEEEERQLLVQALILLSNIALFTALPITQNIRRTLLTLLASNDDEPQLAFLAAKCFAMHQKIDSVVAEALHNAKKLGESSNHRGLCALSSNLLLLQECL